MMKLNDLETLKILNWRDGVTGFLETLCDSELMELVDDGSEFIGSVDGLLEMCKNNQELLTETIERARVSEPENFDISKLFFRFGIYYNESATSNDLVKLFSDDEWVDILTAAIENENSEIIKALRKYATTVSALSPATVAAYRDENYEH